ncbi:MAG: response regulator [Candidatus Aminicenantes bacterium]|jgi:YesN/AraC family two-component response regulator
MKLLIVDDLEEYVDSIEFMAEDYFEQIYKALTLADAKRICAEVVPDTAIIDIRLSEADETNKDGLVLLEWMKKQGFHTKVIMISAYKDFDYAVEALNAGAEYFLKKPVKNAELKETLEKINQGGSFLPKVSGAGYRCR